jgi:L-fucose mutarotase
MMLKGIAEFIGPDLLWVLASMGHADGLLICDRNFSADRVSRRTVSGKLIVLSGIDAPTVIAGILRLFPLDAFVERPLLHMGPTEDVETPLPVHREVELVCQSAEGRPIKSLAIERFAFYPHAESCFAVVQTAESRPYANFILRKGVV